MAAVRHLDFSITVYDKDGTFTHFHYLFSVILLLLYTYLQVACYVTYQFSIIWGILGGISSLD